jgi:hypothetical protein
MALQAMEPAARTAQATGDRGAWQTPGASRPPSRAWPRCESGYTHYELGESASSHPTAVMAQRYTPRLGVREE